MRFTVTYSQIKMECVPRIVGLQGYAKEKIVVCKTGLQMYIYKKIQISQ